MTPAGVIRPIWLPTGLAEPEVAIRPGDDPPGLAPAVGMGNSVKVLPSGVSRTTLLPLYSVNQRLPSGPVAIPRVR